MVILVRKLITSFLISYVITVYFSINLAFGTGQGGQTIHDFLVSAVLVSLYVFVLVFLYGTTISLAVDSILHRWRADKRLKWFVSLLAHIIFGYLFGVMISSLFALIVGIIALLYFLVDQFLTFSVSRWKWKRVTLYTATLIIGSIAILMIVLNQITETVKPLPPFTKEDAVQYATSGEGTTIDQYPEFIGKVEEKVNEYRVTRETSVVELGRETYRVTFQERWNDGELGSSWMSYIVERNGMTLSSNGGTAPPY